MTDCCGVRMIARAGRNCSAESGTTLPARATRLLETR